MKKRQRVKVWMQMVEPNAWAKVRAPHPAASAARTRHVRASRPSLIRERRTGKRRGRGARAKGRPRGRRRDAMSGMMTLRCGEGPRCGMARQAGGLRARSRAGALYQARTGTGFSRFPAGAKQEPASQTERSPIEAEAIARATLFPNNPITCYRVKAESTFLRFERRFHPNLHHAPSRTDFPPI